MKTNLVIIILISLIVNCCITPKYLPTPDKLDTNTHGSYIQIICEKNDNINGELISVEKDYLIVLEEEFSKCRLVPINDILKYKLICAKQNKYGWTIPAGIAVPLLPFQDPAGGGLMPFQGFYPIFTIPINLIVTIAIASTAKNAYKYKSRDLSYTELRKFARFPQGIPPNVDMTIIK